MNLDDYLYNEKELKVKVLTIAGEKVLTGDSNGRHWLDDYYLIHIREPYYLAARDYKWSGANAHSYGIGLSRELVHKALANKKNIMIMVKKHYGYYIADARRIIEFCHKTDSIHMVEKDNIAIQLYVYPILECVYRPKNIAYLLEYLQ